MRKRKNRIYSKQVLHLTSTPPLSKIRSAGILSIWQKETTSSHIWTAIKFEYFDLTKIRFFEIPWFFPDFQQNFKFPDFSLQGFFFHHFPCLPCFPECVATLSYAAFNFLVDVFCLQIILKVYSALRYSLSIVRITVVDPFFFFLLLFLHIYNKNVSSHLILP